MNNRRSFLWSGASALAVSPVVLGFQPAGSLFQQETGIQNLPIDQVQEFVSTAHTHLERTQSLLEKEPRLIRAKYEWAPGDFESAIDAAAHSGSVEIVNFLLSKGASYSIFVAAVLGHSDVVKATLTHNPGLVDSRGPHGIGLLQHALAGGEAAADVAEFLREKGATADEDWVDLEYDDTLADFVTGNYKIERGDRTIEFLIKRDEGSLVIIAGSRPARRLMYQGQSRFAIEGTPAELLFEQNDESGQKCQRVLLKEGFPVGFATRTD